MNSTSRLAKVEAKLDKTVQEVASTLENHSKAIESITNSALAVEVKLNEVDQELDTRLQIYSYHKKLKRCLTYIANPIRAKEKQSLNITVNTNEPGCEEIQDKKWSDSAAEAAMSSPAALIMYH